RRLRPAAKTPRRPRRPRASSKRRPREMAPSAISRQAPGKRVSDTIFRAATIVRAPFRQNRRRTPWIHGPRRRAGYRMRTGMEIKPALVKELRERTGAGMMDCKKALVEANGDVEAAAELLRKSGQAKADKKA